MKNIFNILIICLLFTGCTVKVGTVNFSQGTGDPNLDVNQSDATDVNTDANVPIAGQGSATTQ
jgi:PBP1b-binding outer membrane lipoprotein LpoB